MNRKLKRELLIKLITDKTLYLVEKCYGLENVYLDRIAMNANVSKVTVLKYFPTKEHIVWQWWIDKIDWIGKHPDVAQQPMNLAYANILGCINNLIQEKPHLMHDVARTFGKISRKAGDPLAMLLSGLSKREFCSAIYGHMLCREYIHPGRM